MRNKLNFDLQLFADDVSVGNAGGQDEQSADAGIGQSETILGSVGQPQVAATQTGVVPEQYDFSTIIPQGIEFEQQLLTEYSELAKQAGLSQENANKLGTFGIKLQEQAYQAAEQERIASVQAWAEESRQSLGKDYDNTISLAGQGIAVLERSIPQLREALNQTGAGNHIALIQAFSLVGKMVSEHNGTGLDGGSATGAGDFYSQMYNKTDFSKY